jgi:ferredoxin
MATPTERTPDNAPGRYYIDSSCIDCGQCQVMAPELFARNEDTGFGYVARQPVTEAEIALAEEAREACATTSIGNDGA